MAKRKAPPPRTPLTVGKLLRMLTRVDPSTPVAIAKGCGPEHAIEELSGVREAQGDGEEVKQVLLVASAEVG